MKIFAKNTIKYVVVPVAVTIMSTIIVTEFDLESIKLTSILHPNKKENGDTSTILGNESPSKTVTKPSIGWIYLGRYNERGSWEQPRSSQLLTMNPHNIEGSTLLIDYHSDLNVRDDPWYAANPNDLFDCAHYESAKTGDLVKVNETIKVQEVYPLCKQYIWAKVTRN